MTGTGVGGGKYSFPTKFIMNAIKRAGEPDFIVFTEFVSKYFDGDDKRTLGSGTVKFHI